MAMIHSYEQTDETASGRYFDGVVDYRCYAERRHYICRRRQLRLSTHIVSTSDDYMRFATLLRGITDGTRVHAVNTPLLAELRSRHRLVELIVGLVHETPTNRFSASACAHAACED